MPLSGKEQAALNYLMRIDKQIAIVRNPQVIGTLTDNELEDFYKTLKKFTVALEYWESLFKGRKNEQTRQARGAAGLPEDRDNVGLANIAEALRKTL